MPVSPTETTSESTKSENAADTPELAQEQQYLTGLYQKLDAEREIADRRLTDALSRTGGTPQARSEREASIALHSERLAQLNSVEQGLCFGRLDLDADQLDETDHNGPVYIGRLGLFAEDDDYRPLLIDWRAPVARPFYLATAASPEGVLRRRHLRTLSRQVVGIDDEILDLQAADQGQDLGLAGEAALLAALGRQRTGEMSDIVATIQREQDDIIRETLNGICVVQGGPGTGKTAVALHRVAYLLYTYRDQLSGRGVLVIGPNARFLRYIGQVLPSLGETGVLLSTIGELYPGIVASGTDSWEAAEIKGRLSMVDVLAKGVANRQVVPESAVEIDAEDGVLTLTPADCERARDRARRSLKPHNLARRVFLEQILEVLVAQTIDNFEIGVFEGVPEVSFAKGESQDTTVLDAQDHAAIGKELAADPAVLAAIESLWPVLTPQGFLHDLFESRDWMISASAGILSETECEVLLRDGDAAWTAADVSLLDELAELLGEDDTEARAEQAKKEREERAYAEGVLDVLEQDDEIADEEILRVSDVLDAELLAERQEARDNLTAAQRAAQDRTWAFGHVIVDEAQELSPLAWRMVMRRCPSRSITLVGDIAQTGSPAGISSWQDVLDSYVDDRWRLRQLTVNYRTPSEIMDIAASVLKETASELRAPESVRSAGHRPWRANLSEVDLVDQLPAYVRRELEAIDGGTLAVLCPPALVDSMVDLVGQEFSAEERLSVLTVQQAKGLEFDSVLIVAPEQVVTESSRGWNDLYVALTRATQRLGILHHEPILPALVGAEETDFRK